MTLYYIELKLNASSTVSLIDASSIEFAIIKYKEFNNQFLCILHRNCKVTRLLFLKHIGRL